MLWFGLTGLCSTVEDESTDEADEASVTKLLLLAIRSLLKGSGDVVTAGEALSGVGIIGVGRFSREGFRVMGIVSCALGGPLLPSRTCLAGRCDCLVRPTESSWSTGLLGRWQRCVFESLTDVGGRCYPPQSRLFIMFAQRALALGRYKKNLHCTSKEMPPPRKTERHSPWTLYK
jgi:hypothetical protein